MSFPSAKAGLNFISTSGGERVVGAAGHGVMKKNLRRILQIATGGVRVSSTYVDVTTYRSEGSGEKGGKGAVRRVIILSATRL